MSNKDEFDFEEEVKIKKPEEPKKITSSSETVEETTVSTTKSVVETGDISAVEEVDRWKNRRRMAWLSLYFMFFITLIVIFHVPDNRIESLSLIINWLFMACTSIVGFYMGATAWVDKVKDSKGFKN